MSSQRTFLITGASKGIGRATADRVARAGHRVVGISRHADDPTFPGESVALDLGDRVATQAVLSDLADRFAFDGLVNNVGLVRGQRLGEVTLDALDAVLQVNLVPALLATQALLPGMRERRWGRIVNISSLTVLGIVERTSYAAAKAALISFTRSWALELATSGITVNAVAPGPTETELFRASQAWQRRRKSLSRGRPHGPVRQARGDCRSNHLPAVGRRRFYDRSDLVRRWRRLDRQGISLIVTQGILARDSVARDG